MPGHKTVPVQVWADVDAGIADLVVYLNTIPGVRTHASCEGNMSAGLASGRVPSYRPQVLVSWENDAVLERLKSEFDIEDAGMSSGNTAYLHPRQYTKKRGAVDIHAAWDEFCAGMEQRLEERLNKEGADRDDSAVSHQDKPACPFCGTTMEQKLTQVNTNRFVMAWACTEPCGESSYIHGLDMAPESSLPTLLHCNHCAAEIRGDSLRSVYAETWIGAHQKAHPGHIIIAGPRQTQYEKDPRQPIHCVRLWMP